MQGVVQAGRRRNLLVMVGGDVPDVERARPVLGWGG